MSLLPIILNGANGRMGTVIQSIAHSENVHIEKTLTRQDDPTLAFLNGAKVVVDFSLPEPSLNISKLAAIYKIPLVIGVTGYNATEEKEIQELAAIIPIVWASNFSVGMNVLFHLAEQAQQLLPKSYIPNIEEVHHKHKKDIPSGTAIHLAKIMHKKWDYPNITSIRQDDTVSKHVIEFNESDLEKITLSHISYNRVNLAQGALRAAHWVVDKKPGLYSMLHVLGLKPSCSIS